MDTTSPRREEPVSEPRAIATGSSSFAELLGSPSLPLRVLTRVLTHSLNTWASEKSFSPIGMDLWILNVRLKSRLRWASLAKNKIS